MIIFLTKNYHLLKINQIKNMSTSIKENIIELKKVVIDRLENISIINNMVNVLLIDTSNKDFLNEHKITFKSTNKGNVIISDDIGFERTIYNNIKVYDCVSLRINIEFISLISDFSKKVKLCFLDNFKINFFKKLFSKKLLKYVIKYSYNKDWILIKSDSKIYELVTKCEMFEKSNIKNESNIKNIGSLLLNNNKKIHVYTTTHIENGIYFGSFNDIKLLISKDIKLEHIKKVNIFKLTLYYKYIKSKNFISYLPL